MTKTVAIIGQGLTGVTAGLMLAEHGYDILLVGAKPPLIGGLQLAPMGWKLYAQLGYMMRR
jgi:2-polyprenyl-6-methoxyphenol hydroxylase-like FAD-dependent oxidoreductase